MPRSLTVVEAAPWPFNIRERRAYHYSLNIHEKNEISTQQTHIHSLTQYKLFGNIYWDPLVHFSCFVDRSNWLVERNWRKSSKGKKLHYYNINDIVRRPSAQSDRIATAVQIFEHCETCSNHSLRLLIEIELAFQLVLSQCTCWIKADYMLRFGHPKCIKRHGSRRCWPIVSRISRLGRKP